MLRIHIICVGKLKEKFYAEAVAEYTKRLKAYCSLNITELGEERLPEKPAQAQIDGALEREAQAILAKIPPRSSMIAMCVEGEQRSSQALAKLIDTWANRGEQCLVFVIGGSYGLHQSVKDRAWVRLSMSPMTFPHHLARVMLLEQVYRGFKILEGSSYHK